MKYADGERRYIAPYEFGGKQYLGD
ncbi:hypothetical protein, partial [Acinetobacter soli]